jgi:hypothetical protein
MQNLQSSKGKKLREAIPVEEVPTVANIVPGT